METSSSPPADVEIQIHRHVERRAVDVMAPSPFYVSWILSAGPSTSSATRRNLGLVRHVLAGCRCRPPDESTTHRLLRHPGSSQGAPVYLHYSTEYAQYTYVRLPSARGSGIERHARVHHMADRPSAATWRVSGANKPIPASLRCARNLAW